MDRLVSHVVPGLLAFLIAQDLSAQSMTTLLESGHSGQKLDLVIVGDGFQAGAEQNEFNEFVNNVILENAFAEGPLWESMNAFNIHRINTNSVDSGVTQLTVGCNPTNFSGSYVIQPIVVASKSTHADQDGGWLRRCMLDAGTVGLVIDEDKDQDGERSHDNEQASVIVFSQAFDAVVGGFFGPTPWKLEAGSVFLPATSPPPPPPAPPPPNFRTINLRQSYPTPPVIIALPSSAGAEPTTVRIQNVTTTSFQIAQVEAPPGDGSSSGIMFHYMAVEPGVHQFPDGSYLEAGTVSTAAVQHGSGVSGSEGFTGFALSAPFSNMPLRFAQLQTMNNETGGPPGTAPSIPWLTAAVTGGTSANSLLVALERSQVDDGTIAQQEVVGYVAVQRDLNGAFRDRNGADIAFETLLAGPIQGWHDARVTEAKSTTLDYRYSGAWDRCWMEPGPNTEAALASILATHAPFHDFVFVVLNEARGGGCKSGNRVVMTVGGFWPTVAHEMGHLVGGLADEYCGVGSEGGDEPLAVNVTINTDLDTLKWRDFVSPLTLIPTGINQTPGNGQCTGWNQGPAGAPPPIWDNALDAGLFEGARYKDSGIYRPAISSRMRSNSPPFNPVSYDQMKTMLDPYHEHTFRSSYVGDFTGDGASDIVIHNANSLALYKSVDKELEPIWVSTGGLGPQWPLRSGDKFYVGDFSGDGIDDLYVFNATNWFQPHLGMLRSTGSGFEPVSVYVGNLPGWTMSSSDHFFVADFDGTGRDDLYVFNGSAWSIPHLGMMSSTGTNLLFWKRYDGNLPGWNMRAGDQFFVGNIDGDQFGRDDLYVFNGSDWPIGYLSLLKSTGLELELIQRFENELPGWDDMKPNDRFFVADFDGDGKDDLYVFNGQYWIEPHLQMLKSTGETLVNVIRFDGNIPGVGTLGRNDEIIVADSNGDQRDDIFIYNSRDFATEYLGTMQSTGSTLEAPFGAWQGDWIGSWNLGQVDQFLVGDFDIGGLGWDDLFVRNADWFGLLRSQFYSVQLNAIYPKWIHRHRYHRLGHW